MRSKFSRRNSHTGFKSTAILITFLVCSVFLLVRHIITSMDSLDDIKTNLHSANIFISLENILKAKVRPHKGQNIFFLDTTRMKAMKKERAFTCRQACSIESAALTNPHLEVFVLFVTRHKHDNKIKFSPQLEAILTYPNVHLNRLGIPKSSLKTPMEEFFKSEKLNSSRFIVSHTSDALRLLLLWRYGGTYLDSDMIVQKKLDSVPSNYACDDTDNVVNGAILNFERSIAGRRLTKFFIDELVQNFNGSVWGANGPLLVTKVLQNLCKTNETKKMIEMGTCEGFHVLKHNLCYAVPGLSWDHFFEEKNLEWGLNAVKDSLVVHFWNNLSKKRSLNTNSSSLFSHLALNYCPEVVKACGGEL